jgi:hypothetical protein
MSTKKTHSDDSTAIKTDESESPYPKNGFPGKLHAARNSAPDNASDERILQVASKAHERGCHPETIWAGQTEIGDYGGDAE